MSTKNKDTEKYLERFAEIKFTENDFVALLLPLLCQNGIYKINERELEERLYYYYKNQDFKELFQDIVPKRGITHHELNLYDGLYREKYFSGSIWFEQMHSNILNLRYRPDEDLSRYEEGLSEDGKSKIRQIATELSKRYKAEQNSKVKLRIFGVEPNGSYSLVHGKHHSKWASSELITDGDISKIDYPDTNEHYFYASPINPNEAIQLKDNRVAHVTLVNATYAIEQGVCDGKVRHSIVNTELLEEDQLEEIVNIASQTYEMYQGNQTLLTTEAPYVRKIVLK